MVNFVVYAPQTLPPGMRVSSNSLRPEQPPGRPAGVKVAELGQTPWSEANPCSLRTLVEGDGRALRIKQFLYDWAPPAASIAALWDCQDLRAAPCQGSVVFLGTDYRASLGAVIQLQRTQIEVSTLHGEFSDAELVRVAEGLVVADKEFATVVSDASFHELSYWIRYGMEPYRVPHGLYVHARRRPYGQADAVVLNTLDAVPVAWSLPTAIPGMRFESAACFGEQTEAVWRSPERPHEQLFMINTAVSGEAALVLPPKPESMQAALRTGWELRGRPCWIAGLTEEHGAWECWWEEQNRHRAVFSTASAQFPRVRFEALVQGMQLAT